MEKYVAPEMELIELECEDIVMTSDYELPDLDL